MTQTIALLGRQPALGLAELESLYGADALHPLAGSLVLLDKHHSEITFSRLGGSIKLAKVLTRLESADWKKAIAHLCKNVPEHLGYFPEGKMRLGLNNYGFDASVNEINRAGLQVKKVIKNAGRSVRVVPNTAATLSSAQTLHNQLTGPTGLEILIIRDGSSTLLAQVVAVQDINAYAARDQARPKRDAKVGMLPPKLAQIIINLAVAQNSDIDMIERDILDPFCGTGVVLQEASLMGYEVRGSDLDPRMVEYTQENLRWILQKTQKYTARIRTKDGWAPASLPEDPILMPIIEVADATTHTWLPTPATIACETYLGTPFAYPPRADELKAAMDEADAVHRKFLQNVARQTTPGFRMCIAVPAWFTRDGIKHLKTLASLEELRYTRMSFVHARDTDLVYHREGQIVGRELVVLTRK